MSVLDSSEESHVDAEETNERFKFDSSANDEELEPQQQRDKVRISRTSIYQCPPRRSRSESRNLNRRYSSSRDLHRVCHRASSVGSNSSLPRLLVGSSVASVDDLRDIYTLDEAPPELGRMASSVLLVVSSLLVAICAEFLVDTLDAMVDSGPFSEAFIGLIILPVAGNSAELFTSIYAAAKGNFDLAIGVSAGSSVQISLLVTPLVVITGWILHKDMTMYFDLFGTVALFATTFLVNVLILYGKPSFLEGSLLIACYLIFAVGAYLFPTPDSRAS